MARKKTKTVPAAPMPDTSAVIGYARVSTAEQNLDMQVQALKRAECHRIVTEKVSAASDRRPALENALSTSTPMSRLYEGVGSRMDLQSALIVLGCLVVAFAAGVWAGLPKQ